MKVPNREAPENDILLLETTSFDSEAAPRLFHRTPSFILACSILGSLDALCPKPRADESPKHTKLRLGLVGF